MNQVVLVGRLVREPEISHTDTGFPIANYVLAVSRNWDRAKTDFIKCVALGKNADFVNQYLRKGMKISVEGSIQTGSYEKNGMKIYTTEVLVNHHEFVESKSAWERRHSSENYGQQASTYSQPVNQRYSKDTPYSAALNSPNGWIGPRPSNASITYGDEFEDAIPEELPFKIK